MARVKRSVHAKKKRRVILDRAPGVLRQQEPQLPRRQRAGHAQPAVRLPRPAGPQGRLPVAVDPAHQRRLPPGRHQLQPVHRRAEGRRHRGRPQGPRRPRRHRSGGVRRPGQASRRRRCRAGACRAYADDPPRARRNPRLAAAAAAVAASRRFPGRADGRSSSRARRWSADAVAAGRRAARGRLRAERRPGVARRGSTPPASTLACTPTCWRRVTDAVTPQGVAAVARDRRGRPSTTSPAGAPGAGARRRRRSRQRRHAAAQSPRPPGSGRYCFSRRVGRPVVTQVRAGVGGLGVPGAGGQRRGGGDACSTRSRPRAGAASAPAPLDAPPYDDGRPRRPASRSCSATRPTACPPTSTTTLDGWVTIPMAGRHRVAQRGHGRHPPLLRGGARRGR